jgi:DNA-binding transcriptional LysR family regulator
MRSRRVDLNLLLVFDTVMRERSLTKAGKVLNLTPSAVSHALGRLRHALKDDLFLRDGFDMKPTLRALELADLVHGSLSALQSALANVPFDPAQSARTFRLAIGDYGGMLILPPLMERFARTAPHLDLQIVPAARIDVGQQLAQGAVDLVFGWFDTLSTGLHRRTILYETNVLIVRAEHPLTRQVLTVEKVFAFPHLVVHMIGAQDGQGDGFLQDGGLARRVWMETMVLEAQHHGDVAARVALTVPNFALVPPILRRSDLVANLPQRLAHRAVVEGGLVILDPLEPPVSVALAVAWHGRSNGDAGLRWLVEEIAAVCAEIEDRPTG